MVNDMVDKRVILETDRLQLREMRMSDLAALSVMLQDEKVMYAYNGAFNDEETVAWMQKQLRRYEEYGFGLWGMFDKVSGEMIGQCGITMQEYKTMLVPEIGYLLAYKHWHNWKNRSRLGQCAGADWDTFDAAKLMIFSETVAF